jgi:uncharacterized membrane protein YhdT
MVSCFGSWFLAIALVIFLIKKVFVDFDLNEEGKIMDVSNKDDRR